MPRRCARRPRPLRLTAQDLHKLGVCDVVIKEPMGGAQRRPRGGDRGVGRAISSMLAQLEGRGAGETDRGAPAQVSRHGVQGGWPRDHAAGSAGRGLPAVAVPPAAGPGGGWPAMTPVTDFEWSYLADTVMGGVSEGQARVEEGALRLTGTVSTANRGGFIQVRTEMPGGLPAGTTALRVARARQWRAVFRASATSPDAAALAVLPAGVRHRARLGRGGCCPCRASRLRVG